MFHVFYIYVTGDEAWIVGANKIIWLWNNSALTTENSKNLQRYAKKPTALGNTVILRNLRENSKNLRKPLILWKPIRLHSCHRSSSGLSGIIETSWKIKPHIQIYWKMNMHQTIFQLKSTMPGIHSRSSKSTRFWGNQMNLRKNSWFWITIHFRISQLL